VSTFGREEDARWFRKRYSETGDRRYLRRAEETEAWLKPTTEEPAAAATANGLDNSNGGH
jgi:hypothetical protein